MASPSKRIIITGASSGIGRALALAYGRRNARMVLVARRVGALGEVAEAARVAGGEVRTIALDVTEPDASERILALADEAFDGVDTVIMNAGMGYPEFVDTFSAERAERVMAVNYFSAVRMIAAVMPRMRAADKGQLVAVTSLASLRGMPGSGAYNASKAALTVLMESLRTELRGSGIIVTTIFPGFVRTEMTDQNEFYMPFMLEADKAARRVAAAIERGAVDYRFPKRLSSLVRLSTYAPNALYDWFVARGREALRRK